MQREWSCSFSPLCSNSSGIVFSERWDARGRSLVLWLPHNGEKPKPWGRVCKNVCWWALNGERLFKRVYPAQGIVLLPEDIGYQIKDPGLGAKTSPWAPPQAIQVIALALHCPGELDRETLLLKAPHIWSHDLGRSNWPEGLLLLPSFHGTGRCYAGFWGRQVTSSFT